MARPLLAITLWMLLIHSAAADDFRLKSEIFVGQAKTASSQNTTLFVGGQVYDVLSDPEEITRFNVSAERFDLLAPAIGVRTTISAGQAAEAVQKIEARAASRTDPLSAFYRQPKFDAAFDATSGRLTLDSEHVQYRAHTTAAPSDDVVRRYRAYADAFTRLNTAAHRGAPLPGPRLVLNRELGDRRRLPSEVHLKVAGPEGRSVAFRSVHAYAWKISDDDRKLVARADELARTLKPLDWDAFLIKLAGETASR